MKLEKIITLTQATTVRRILFYAMERSLRATGCDLPIWVIPFDDGRFDLPKASEWWELTQLTNWLKQENALNFLRKYQALTTPNYQFADTDVIFLKNPSKILAPHDGFVVCCNHWRDYEHTCTQESERLMRQRSTLWQRNVFNSGQFACAPQLYDEGGLMDRAMREDLRYTCLHSGPDQAGLNALVFVSGVDVTNLTLPPYNLESSWAGDYTDVDYKSTWVEDVRSPYLIHWAGMPMHQPRPIDELCYAFMSQKERKEFMEAYQRDVVARFAKRRWMPQGILRRFKSAVKSFIQTWKQG
jgi:hypothetical protein